MKNRGLCHPDCPWCTREFWAWLKMRMRDMARPRRGEKTSFADAAATSVHP